MQNQRGLQPLRDGFRTFRQKQPFFHSLFSPYIQFSNRIEGFSPRGNDRSLFLKPPYNPPSPCIAARLHLWRLPCGYLCSEFDLIDRNLKSPHLVADEIVHAEP